MDLKIINYCCYINKSQNYKYNAPILVFLCRDRNLNYKIVFICDKKNLSPEMYIPADEVDIASIIDNVVKVEKAPDSNYGEKVVKLETTFPYEVGHNRKHFSHTFLSDLKWEKMCIQKMGLQTPYIRVPDDFEANWLTVPDIEELPTDEQFYVPIRWIGWDIEVNYERTYPIFTGWEDAAKNDIISISAYDSYTKEYHIFFWHPSLQMEFLINDTDKKIFKWKDWKRIGKYYVPALKKIKKYEKNNPIFVHMCPTEETMLKEYFNWYSYCRPDAQFGFNSEGGYRMSTKEGNSRKYWFNGFDMPFVYHRCKTIGLLKELEMMSPLPNHIKGVKWRRQGGDRISVQIEGVCQVDFIYTADIFGYHKKFNDFREGNLQGFMSFFLGFGKVDHEEQIFEMWRDNIKSDYDPTNAEECGIKKRKNLVKELFENAKNQCSEN